MTLRQQIVNAYKFAGIADETMRALLTLFSHKYKRKIEGLKDLTEEELQRLLAKIQDGTIDQWSHGLMEILTKACTEHSVTPGDLSAYCKAHVGLATAGGMTHQNRAKVYEAVVSGQVAEWCAAQAAEK